VCGIHNLPYRGLSIRVVLEVLVGKAINFLLSKIADGDDVVLCVKYACAGLAEEADGLGQIVIYRLHLFDKCIDFGGCGIGCATKPGTAVENLGASEPPLVERLLKLSLR